MRRLATVVFKSFTIPAKPGKYISIEKKGQVRKQSKITINLK
jgi:hypothetical protein